MTLLVQANLAGRWADGAEQRGVDDVGLALAAAIADEPVHATTPTYPASRPQGSIDHVVASGHRRWAASALDLGRCAATRLEDGRCSDHRALAVRIAL